MSKKILLADDSVTIQKVISITFANEDYQLEIVGDGDEAVRKARELKPDLVMVDVGMPGRNGYEVCEALKSDQALRSTPVMLLAGTFEPLDLSEAERVGADDHIIKPFESQDLLDKVRSLTARAEPARPAPSEPSAAASALDEEPAFDIAEEWGEGDFLGISEEFAKKPDAGAEETGPIPGFDEGFSLEDVSAPTEAKEAAPAAPEASAAPESDFYDIEFNEDELKPEAQAPAEPAGGEPAGGEPTGGEPTGGEPAEETGPVFEDVFAPAAAEAAPEPSAGFEPFTGSYAEASFGAAEEGAPPTGGEPTGGEPTGGEPTVVEPAGGEPTGGEPIGGEPIGFEPTVVEPAGGEPAGGEPAGGEIMPEAPASQAGEVAAEAARRVEEEAVRVVTERIEGTELPKEKIEEIVSRVARQVVEEIAWEVVPELAEDLISKELEKVREAFSKIR